MKLASLIVDCAVLVISAFLFIGYSIGHRGDGIAWGFLLTVIGGLNVYLFNSKKRGKRMGERAKREWRGRGEREGKNARRRGWGRGKGKGKEGKVRFLIWKFGYNFTDFEVLLYEIWNFHTAIMW